MGTTLNIAHEQPVYLKKKRRKNLVDITGRRFERWDGLHIDENREYGRTKEIYWICKCDCGTIRPVSGARLRKGKSKSCGCYQRDMTFIDLDGRIFGRLLVVDISEKTRSGHKKTTYWKCKCICGNFVDAPTSQLLNGDSISCGCKTKKQLANGLKKYEYPEPNPELWEMT